MDTQTKQRFENFWLVSSDEITQPLLTTPKTLFCLLKEAVPVKERAFVFVRGKGGDGGGFSM